MRTIARWALAGVVALAAHANQSVIAQELSAAQIIEKNAAARGGAEAWRKVQTMAWVGHVESANATGRNMRFVLAQKRPHNTRFEITGENQRSLRVYDGSNGWKVRPSASGMPEAQPYTTEELSFARGAQVIDGPLMDYAAKGAAITPGGVDSVGGRKAYRLDVRQVSGLGARIWVDAETFLEIRYDRESRTLDKPSTVSVTYRDYRPFEGLQMPMVIETGSSTDSAKNKLVIEKVALNPPMEEQMFAKPRLPVARHNGVIVDTRSALAPPTVRRSP